MRQSAKKTALKNRDTCQPALAWMYALILDCGGLQEFIHRGHGFRDDDVARELGVLGLVGSDDEYSSMLDDEQSTGAKLRRSFRDRVQSALRRERANRCGNEASYVLPDNLAANISSLATLIELSEVDQKLLAFCAILKTESLLEDCANLTGLISYGRMLRILSELLDVSVEDIRQSFSNDGRLTHSGLLDVTRYSGGRNCFSDYLAFTNKDLLFSLRYHQGSTIEVFQSAFRKAPTAQLSVEDFSHLQDQFSIARSYLQYAISSRQEGVNVLIYGPPGTGKSQLTRVLAKELDVDLYEIACTNSQGDPINRQGRLCALSSAMSVIGQQQALVLLDEIEDLFSGNREFSRHIGSHENLKGWINRMLEENPIPCFWLTNNIDALDNAYIRRFDLVMKLDNPPRIQRERIVLQASNDRLSQGFVGKLVSHEQLMPAVITRALQVAERAVGPDGPFEATVESLVDATLEAQGFARLAHGRNQSLPSFYSPQLSNADVDLQQLLDGLRLHAEARMCFYGPPGTGKTAFAHWLARELGRPLLTHRASDLISPYVGLTEKNLARAFSQARDDQAVLLLDEVDSFLQDRRNARHSWEVSAVNEMLTQMESYPGLFIASTNLMGNLDEASLRRFDLKIGFGYLTTSQAVQLLEEHLQQLSLAPPNELKLTELLKNSRLTPGDFALLARRARFKAFTDSTQFIEALLAESALKSHSPKHPIGFIH